MAAAIPWIISLVGMGISAYSQYKGGKSQQEAAMAAGQGVQTVAESQGALSDYNASVADLQAQDAIERGAEEESRFRTQVRGAIGAQRAGFAGGNVDVGFGSAVDVQGDAAYLGELDALTIRRNADREAWGFNVQAYNYRRQAEIQRKGGANAAAAGQAYGNSNAATLGAAGTLLGGVGSLLQMKYGFRKVA